MEARDALLPLLDAFQCLVRGTWPKGNNQDFLGRVNKYAQRQKWAALLKAFQTAVQKASISLSRTHVMSCSWAPVSLRLSCRDCMIQRLL